MTSKQRFQRRERDENAPFVVSAEAALHALPGWLKKRQYNACALGLQDRHGNSMIGLSWERNPDSDWSKHDRAGLVLIKASALYDRALEIVEANYSGRRVEPRP